ncbi:MAG: PhnD/SsuA/transferrin family substrate-binding protein [Chloroflexota bacterium]
MRKPFVANARMHNVAPPVGAAWDLLFGYIAKTTKIPLPIINHAFPTPIKELWARSDMGCVIMCGYPYALAEPRPRLLATPIPSLPRYHNKPVAFTDLLVAKDSPYETLEDTFGGRICWTVDYSQSGFNGLRHHLLQFRTAVSPTLYSQSIGPIGTFSVGLERMARGEIDVVPIDSFYHDLMRRYTPDAVANTRIIATTAAYSIPPIVADTDIPLDMADALRMALRNMHTKPNLQPALDALCIKKFVAVEPDYYDALLEQDREAHAAGYPIPA